MASIYPLVIFSLFVPPSAGSNSLPPLLTFSHQNANDPLLFMAVHCFVYFLIPLTFFLSMLLLPCHLTKPDINKPVSVFFFNNISVATRALSLATLLLGMSLMATYSFSIPLDQGIVCLFLAAVAIRIGSLHQAPPLFALCISVSTLLFVEPLLSNSQQLPYNPLLHIPIGLLIYIQIPFTFMLGMTLLLIHAVPGFSVKCLHMALRGMVITILLVGAYVVAYLGVADVAVISGGATKVGVS